MLNWSITFLLLDSSPVCSVYGSGGGRDSDRLGSVRGFSGAVPDQPGDGPQQGRLEPIRHEQQVKPLGVGELAQIPHFYAA